MVTEIENYSATEEPFFSTLGKRNSHYSQRMKWDLVPRLNRIEDQVRDIKGLIEKDTYCDDVIIQICAIQSVLNSVAKILLEEQLKNCVEKRVKDGDMSALDKALVTIQKLIKK